MKNCLIITPFYPYPDYDWIKKDSKVVYYLTEQKNDDINIIIVYYYLRTKFVAIRSLLNVTKIRSYKDCLLQDDRGNDVLFFEHPCLVPGRANNIPVFDRKYAKVLNDYLVSKSIILDSITVHFPSRFTDFAKKIEANQKIAIVHSFDVKPKNIRGLSAKLDCYDKVGYRSVNIKRSVTEECGCEKYSFMCLSGIPDKYIKSAYLRTDWRIDSVLRLTFVGRLDENKNTIQILQSLNYLPNTCKVHITIIGEGEQRKILEDYVITNKVSDIVTFTGRLDRDLVYDYLQKSDVFVLTSYKETLGLSYFEAITAGNIVVGSRNQGIFGLFAEEEGCYFVNPDSPQELADTIASIYNMDVNDIINIRKRSMNRIKEFSDSRLSCNYLEHISE